MRARIRLLARPHLGREGFALGGALRAVILVRGHRLRVQCSARGQAHTVSAMGLRVDRADGHLLRSGRSVLGGAPSEEQVTIGLFWLGHLSVFCTLLVAALKSLRLVRDGVSSAVAPGSKKYGAADGQKDGILCSSRGFDSGCSIVAQNRVSPRKVRECKETAAQAGSLVRANTRALATYECCGIQAATSPARAPLLAGRPFRSHARTCASSRRDAGTVGRGGLDLPTNHLDDLGDFHGLRGPDTWPRGEMCRSVQHHDDSIRHAV